MNGQLRLVVGVAVGLMLVQVVAVGAAVSAAQQLPAGETIAYVAPGTGGDDIFIRDLSTGLAQNLTHRLEDSNEREPAWSPDGLRIVFSSWQQTNEVANIYVIDMDGSNLRQLTGLDADYDSSPMWSPDGSQLAYVSIRSSGGALYVMDANGDDKRLLTEMIVPGSTPTWSADGRSIAFTARAEGRGDEIYLTDVDGNHHRRLIEGAYIFPAWSPDGSRVAFMGRESRAQIWVMDADSGVLQEFIVAVGLYPLAWLPDSRRLAFLFHQCLCDPTTYLLDTASGEVERFPFGGYRGSLPVWRPG
jgi:TolB protein